MIPLIVIRPEPGCAASVAAARDLGLDAHGCPLFAVRPLAWTGPAPEQFSALLIGSANALRHGGPELDRYRDLPVHAVGKATAEAALAAGFLVARTGSGGLQAVLDAVPPGTALLRLAGAERIALTPPASVTMAERTVYISEPLPMSATLANLLAKPAVILLHSAEAARHFTAECDRLGLPRTNLALATIGPRVSAVAGTGWRALETADAPCESALLAKARDLCQTPPGR
jgi:uroporphyrinogen-III synthase